MAVSIAGCGSSGSDTVTAPQASAAAQTACGSITQGGGSSSIAACAQGYDAAKAGMSQEKSCDRLGYKAIVTTENVNDCQAGWSSADVAGKAAATPPSAAAKTACGSITQGGGSASIAACAQGFDAAKAGTSEETTCDSLGNGAILATENVDECQAGWSAG